MGDDLEPLITQCPNCDARFRVSESQLQIAQGKVRCGACLFVFDGTQFLHVGDERLTVEPEAEVDALLDELDDPQQGALASSLQPTEDEPPSSSPPAASEPAAEVPAGSDALSALEDELLAELRDPQPAPIFADPETPVEQEPLDEAFPSSADIVQDEHEDHDSGDAMPSFTSHDVDPPAEAGALEAVEPASADVSPASDELNTEPAAVAWVATSAPAEQELEQAPVPAEQIAAQAADAPDLADPESDPEPKAEPSPDAEPAAPGPGNRLQDFLSEEDDFLGYEPAPRRSYATYVLIVLAALGLPLQVAWLQFDSWSTDLRFRPYYAQACEWLGCELPVMRDVSQIERREFHMRFHPDAENALVFDMLLVNQAPFPQPYPLIELVATTEGGHLVAGRRFKPAEYLHGEVSVESLMQPRTPVHVSLEIERPKHPNLEFSAVLR